MVTGVVHTCHSHKQNALCPAWSPRYLKACYMTNGPKPRGSGCVCCWVSVRVGHTITTITTQAFNPLIGRELMCVRVINTTTAITGYPGVSAWYQCQFDDSSWMRITDRDYKCKGGSDSVTMQENGVGFIGDSSRKDKLFARIGRLQDTENKNLNMYIYHSGWACPDGTSCYKDWRREIGNRQGY